MGTDPRPRRRLRVVAAGAAATLLVLCAGARAESDADRPIDIDPVWSPRGDWIAFERFHEETQTTPRGYELMIVRPDGSGARVLGRGRSVMAGFVDTADISWSPDGTRIAFRAPPEPVSDDRSDIDVVDVATGVAHAVATAGDDDGPAWSPDGTTIAYAEDGHLAFVRPDGSGRRVLPIPGFGLRWAPDGRALAAYGGSLIASDPAGAPLAVVTPAGDERVVVRDAITPAAWSPDGSELALMSVAGLVLVRADGSERRVAVPEVYPDELIAGPDPPAWSPDGRTIAFESYGCAHGYECADWHGPELAFFDVASGAVRAPHQHGFGSFSWEPGGARVAASAVGPCGGASLALFDPTTGASRLLSQDDCHIDGSDGPDTIAGTPRRDVIAAGAGDDVVTAGAGEDTVAAGPGRDRVDGGSGYDTIAGGPGADRLDGGVGRDPCGSFCVVGGDWLKGGPGNDTLVSRVSGGNLDGGDGNDILLTAEAHDPGDEFADAETAVRGGRGADTIRIGRAAALVIPGPGRDDVRGGGGDDVIRADDGQPDTISCGGGRDEVRADRVDRVAKDCERVTLPGGRRRRG